MVFTYSNLYVDGRRFVGFNHTGSVNLSGSRIILCNSVFDNGQLCSCPIAPVYTQASKPGTVLNLSKLKKITATAPNRF